MATVAGIRFKKAGKVYYFDPTSVWPQPGDMVVVETTRGLELGETVTGAREVSDDQIVAPLKKVLRIATPEDISHAAQSAEREKEAFILCQTRIEERKLEMKLVDVEYTFDGSKIIFYFTANGRVDFRDLVKDLAAVFKTRIELRQIGVRDEAKMLGGLGACGRPICCAAFLNDFQPVSIKMAKEQSLSLNPTKISGQCGRLMCCLKYEQEYYETTLKKIPRVGREIVTPDGTGVIVEIAAIREKVRVRIRQSDDTYDVKEYGLDEVRKPGVVQPENTEEKDVPEEKTMEVIKSEEPDGDAVEEDATPVNASAPVRPERIEKENKVRTDKPQQARRRNRGRKQSAEQYFEKAVSSEDQSAETENLQPAENLPEQNSQEESDANE